MSKKFSDRANIIMQRTYSRPLEGGGSETWEQVVERVVKHQRWLWQRALGDVPLSEEQEAELGEMRNLLLERKASVSGRTLWLGGTDVSKVREASQFNCAHLQVETVHDVVDAFWLLLQGCGVGFTPVVGTLNGFMQPHEVKLIRSQRHLLEQKKGREHNVETLTEDSDGRAVWRISIGDSAESWAKAVGKLLVGKKKADVLELDFSQIRPAGERLKGYGWISSGDETFAPALARIADILNRKAGSLLDEMDILDIMNHLGTTLSSRRSAEIALMDAENPKWKEFALAKKDFWLHNNAHRQQSNNSLVFSKKPSKEKLAEVFGIIQEGGGSEPGIINGEEARKRAPWFKGVNPCVPGDTLILTDKGHVPIKDCVGKEVNVWNGERFAPVTPFSTGVNPLVTVKLSDGTKLACTPYHKWILAGGVRVMAEELQYGDRLEKFDMPVVAGGEDYAVDAYSQGFYSGDGNAGYSFSFVYEPKFPVVKRLKGTVSGEDNYGRMRWAHPGPMFDKGFVPVKGSLDYCLNWLAGVLDADGTVTRDLNGNGLQLSSTNFEFLSDVRLMLTRLGVRAKLVAGHPPRMALLPDGKGGQALYDCKAVYRLLISNMDTYNLMKLGLTFERLKVHGNPPQRDARRFVTVVGVTQEEDWVETFCFEEPLTNRGTFNGIVTGQCAEILLPNRGFCNLVELNVAAFKSNNFDLYRAAYIMGRANYRQTCVNLRDGVLQSAWHENNEFLRLCGVGLTGIASVHFTQHDFHVIQAKAIYGATSMAHELKMPLPKAVTTVKPSGTLSKIMDTTEGVHKPLGRYIFNNVRFGVHDPLVEKLRNANYNVFPDPSSPDAVLVTFPVKFEGVDFDTVNGVEVNLESAVSQLNRYKELMLNYVDHNCSITVSYSPEEVPAIVDWLYENWDCYVGVSFLYRTDPTKTAKDLGYPYLPQEVVTKDAYEAYVKTLRPLEGDFSGQNELTEGADDYVIDAGDECAGGVCPVR